MNEGGPPGAFDDFLQTLAHLLHLGARQRQAIIEELQSHLEARYEDLVREGVAPREAAARALAEFGDAAALAAELSTWFHLKRRRRLMRWTTGTLAGMFLLATAVIALWPDRPGPWGSAPAMAQQKPAQAASRPADDPDEALWQSLEARIDVELASTPVEDALAYLSQEAHLQYYCERRAIEDAGIDLSTCTVSLKLKNIPAEMALRLVLEQAELAYTVENGVVIVTTPDGLHERGLVVRVYRVDDLVEAPRREAPAKAGRAVAPSETADGSGTAGQSEGSPGATMRSGTMGGLGGFGAPGGFGPGGHGGGLGMTGYRLRTPSSDDMEALISVIVNTVTPGSWEDNGGGPGRICVFRGALIVAQTARNHRQIRELLEELRRATRGSSQTAGQHGGKSATSS